MATPPWQIVGNRGMLATSLFGLVKMSPNYIILT